MTRREAEIKYKHFDAEMDALDQRLTAMAESLMGTLDIPRHIRVDLLCGGMTR